VNVDAVVSSGGNNEREEAKVIRSLVKEGAAVVSAMKDVNTQARFIQSMQPGHSGELSKRCTKAKSR